MRYTELDLKNLDLFERKGLILNYTSQRVIIKTTHEPWLQRGKILGESPNERLGGLAYLFKSEDATRALETGEVTTGKKRLVNYLDTEKILIEGQARFKDIRRCSRAN